MSNIGVAVIPAKGTSIGIVGKNLQTVGGRTLLERTIDQAQQAERIDQIFVVTEDDTIAELSEKHGATVFRCSAEMSDNRTMAWEKVRLVAESFKECRGGIEPLFLELHPTYPFRRPELIDACIGVLSLHKEWDGVLVGSFCHDRVWRKKGSGFERVNTDIPIKARQYQEPLAIDHFGLCNVYRHALALSGNPYGGKLELYISDFNPRQLIDIDTAEDLRLCQAIARDASCKSPPIL